MNASFRKWAAYRKGMILSNRIDDLTASFPPNERFRLTDQICRSASSVCANLAESFAKRRYPKHFIAKITDSYGENCETQMWLDKALARGYITNKQYKEHNDLADEVGRLLHFMEHNPDHYAKKSNTK
ncbi:four helix bundle protein [Neolewinella aurantiaca]|uniref:Four helix bundle protein n=1 Tax=Neolewinella aurantiaca TaxID=2602767 RepID=A0A5C7FM44_9BACT|nr:four helix bundle protein [Neolewinella aurantiaca]TXF91130.1 four helix bundle protein [Neolewinella aurantiaca]